MKPKYIPDETDLMRAYAENKRYQKALKEAKKRAKRRLKEKLEEL